MFKLFLVPVHFQFKLVHAFVGFKDHILYVVKAVLLVGDALFKLFNFVLKTTTLTLSNLLHVFFGFNFFVFIVNE